MDAVFPITQRNGEVFHTLSDFKQLFESVKSGRYILSQGHGWHSGVHLTTQMVPWGKGIRPIQAMLSGNIVAYRINPEYLKSTYQEQELSFSNNFVLVEHIAKSPKPDEEADFYFYSLYMHLAPPSDIGANASITTRYRLLKARNVRTFKFDAEPERSKKNKTVTLPTGSVLEYLYADENQTKPYVIGSKTYHNIKCRVISLGSNTDKEVNSLKGKMVWFASGLNSPFDILNNPEVVSKEPMNEPEWMSHPLAQIRDGSVQVIKVANTDGTPISETIIPIKAGDDIGYMGLHEYSQDTHATKKEDNRVHIEIFSIDQPSEFFLKSIGAKNATMSDFTLIDGSSSSGALDESNTFFQEIASKVTEENKDGTKVDFSTYTPKNLKVYLNTKQEKFEKLIVKHPSEWYDQSDTHMFNAVIETGRKLLEDKLIMRFMSKEEYDKSDYKKLILEAHDKLVDHEKERIDKLAWIQEASELEIPKTLWHFWPFSLSTSELITFEMIFAANLKMNEKQCRAIQPYINKYAINYNMTNPKVIAHFLSQVGHESHFVAATESLSYSKKRMREYFGCKYGKDNYNRENDSCDLGQLRPKLWTHEDDYARNSKKLANYVYADRMGNGNENSGDGYKFRGRGLIQITGRDKYTAFTAYHNSKNIDDQQDFLINPELVADSLDYATSSAFYFWYKFKKINDEFSSSASVIDITKKVNGGTNGLKDREKRYKMVTKQMGMSSNE
ncbi:glycoside hydrolase family 19 protein [Aliivibrio fischeri]|uniref:glycoside hydrolase family 19 protein n=1 Tax=Aliivibrio fischeri TaxID=668 RepID=UPI00198B056C|nr:hypothetical protein [Aliivibrio fischeri]USR96975.1 hypothetical protein AVFI_17450 [Aliivibrio fischeri ATCC 7744 = JCM 18803 = DSM 507]GGK50737.1 hypothetical protein GCM10007987_37250 [Aliivibrio fischeri]